MMMKVSSVIVRVLLYKLLLVESCHVACRSR